MVLTTGSNTRALASQSRYQRAVAETNYRGFLQSIGQLHVLENGPVAAGRLRPPFQMQPLLPDVRNIHRMTVGCAARSGHEVQVGHRIDGGELGQCAQRRGLAVFSGLAAGADDARAAVGKGQGEENDASRGRDTDLLHEFAPQRRPGDCEDEAWDLLIKALLSYCQLVVINVFDHKSLPSLLSRCPAK